MSKLLITILLIGLFAVPSERTCSCRKASDGDVPHGANEDIQYSEKTVKSINGTVSFNYGDEPIEGAVVEVYDVTAADKNLTNREIMGQRPRREACVTSEDGRFCFPNLPSGTYVLRAGRGESGGMNDVHMRVRVDRRWWSKWFRPNKTIKFGLTPGT